MLSRQMSERIFQSHNRNETPPKLSQRGSYSEYFSVLARSLALLWPQTRQHNSSTSCVPLHCPSVSTLAKAYKNQLQWEKKKTDLALFTVTLYLSWWQA